ncbi:MAG: radical SAM protein, partial [Fidelibacterota bacterium]
MSTPVKTVALKTVGCKLNFAETDTLARAFRERGYRTVPFREPADIYILNTCSVTEHADRDSRKLLRQARRRNPHAFIAVTGCYAQLKPEDVARLPEVNAVFGSAEKLSLIEHLESRDFTRTSISTTPVDRLTTFFPSHSLESRTRAYLKVQDGCDYPCTYCTIPLARGRSRNAPVTRLVEEARTIAAAGIREIVLTGVNVGDFGKSTGESLALLLRTLLTETEVPRLRISSIEPNLLTDEILDLVPAFPALM